MYREGLLKLAWLDLLVFGGMGWLGGATVLDFVLSSRFRLSLELAILLWMALYLPVGFVIGRRLERAYTASLYD